MGYEMSNVVKTVYLPFDNNDAAISIEDYKEKYGIDLRDIFDIVPSSNPSQDWAWAELKNPATKLYAVVTEALQGYAMLRGVQLINFVRDGSGYSYILRGGFNADGYAYSVALGIKFKKDGTISIEDI